MLFDMEMQIFPRSEGPVPLSPRPDHNTAIFPEHLLTPSSRAPSVNHHNTPQPFSKEAFMRNVSEGEIDRRIKVNNANEIAEGCIKSATLFTKETNEAARCAQVLALEHMVKQLRELVMPLQDPVPIPVRDPSSLQPMET
jgi:hypothetical protein